MHKHALLLSLIVSFSLFGFDEHALYYQMEYEPKEQKKQFSEEETLEAVAAELHRRLQDHQTDDARMASDAVKTQFLQLQEKIDHQVSDFLINCAPKELQEYIAQIKTASETEDECLRNELALHGIILHGKPGVGKTELAKSIAVATGRKCMVIDCTRLANEYQNSGSQNLIKAIEKIVETGQKYIIVLDEINALINPKKILNSADDTGLALGLQLDQYSQDQQILFIATTNKPSDLPLQLKTRFDVSIEVNLPNNKTVKKIYNYYSKISDEKFLDWLASQSKQFSARDIKKICYQAKAKAVVRKENVPSKNDFERVIKNMHQKNYDSQNTWEYLDTTWNIISKTVYVAQATGQTIYFFVKVVSTINEIFNSNKSHQSSTVFNNKTQHNTLKPIVLTGKVVDSK